MLISPPFKQTLLHSNCLYHRQILQSHPSLALHPRRRATTWNDGEKGAPKAAQTAAVRKLFHQQQGANVLLWLLQAC